MKLLGFLLSRDQFCVALVEPGLDRFPLLLHLLDIEQLDPLPFLVHFLLPFLDFVDPDLPFGLDRC
jgi:hypothetical protein